MSMNLFLQAFSTEDVAAMKQDHALVDDWISDEQRCIVATDIGTAWDVLNKLLSGTGFRGDEFLDDVLFNGCELIDTDTVRQYSAQLSGWSHERLLKGLRDFNPANEAYHLEFFRDEEQDLVVEFDKLVAFYREAAAKNLGVLHYAA
jgi:hypothetical protein